MEPEEGNTHQEAATNPMMSLQSCRKFLMVVRDFPPGCGSAARLQPAEVCADSSTKPTVTEVGSQKPTMNAGKALDKRQGAAGPMVAGQCSGMVKNMVPRMDGPKKTKSVSLGGKTGVVMSRGSELARPNDCGVTARARVLECLRMFRDICRNQVEENKKLVKEGKKAVRRVDVHAYKQLKNERKLVNQNQQKPGHVPGVNIRDTFYYRFELFAVGVHHQVEGGIDYMTYKGQMVATSIVASRSGCDDMSNPNELVYVGAGGSRGRDKNQDQQLTGGNLALKNSIRTKNRVRVIRKVAATVRDMELVTSVPEVYIYDGLYTVEKLEEDCRSGSKVYKFTLKRVEHQT